MRRVVVIGSTGSGKSRFAQSLAADLHVPYVDTDDLFWEPGWVEVHNDVFRQRLDEASSGDAWVIAGNYLGRAVDITWPRADTLVWLDLPLPLVLYRSITRTIRRGITKEVVCNGNTEKLRYVLPYPGGEKPLWVYAIGFYRTQRARIVALLADHPHLQVHRLTSRAEVARFLAAARPPQSA